MHEPAVDAPALLHREGVDGSSPSEGSGKAPQTGAFSSGATCRTTSNVSVATAANRSPLNDVVHLRHHWLTGVGSERGHDRHQGLAKCIERLLGIPDVEHLNLPVSLKSDVVQPTGGSSGAGRF